MGAVKRIYSAPRRPVLFLSVLKRENSGRSVGKRQLPKPGEKAAGPCQQGGQQHAEQQNFPPAPVSWERAGEAGGFLFAFGKSGRQLPRRFQIPGIDIETDAGEGKSAAQLGLQSNRRISDENRDSFALEQSGQQTGFRRAGRAPSCPPPEGGPAPFPADRPSGRTGSQRRRKIPRGIPRRISDTRACRFLLFSIMAESGPARNRGIAEPARHMLG